MKIKGAIFDLDGTLFDSMIMWRTLASRYIRSLGKEPSASLDEQIMTMTLEEGIAMMRREYEIDLAPEKVHEAMMKTAHDYYMTSLKYKPGAEDMLREMKSAGVRMSIATATDREVVEPALRQIGAFDYIDGMFTCGEVNAGKREPVIYEKALEFIGTPRDETLVFEDYAYAAETAEKAGFRVVGIFDKYSYETGGDLREYVSYYLPDYSHWPGLKKLEQLL